jgi:hypothetical protein
VRFALLAASAALAFTGFAACSKQTDTEPTSGPGGFGGSSSSSNVGGEGGRGGGAGGSDAGPTVMPPAFDIVGVVGTGQSLSVGASGVPVLSTSQPYKNLKLLDSGPDLKYDGVGDDLSLVPLTAPIRGYYNGYPAGPYPNNIIGETPHEGMANQLSATAMEAGGFEYVSAHSVVGESGQGISVIKKDGTGKAYAATLYEVAAVRDLAKAMGKTYGVAAILLTHGETDASDATYGEQIRKLWADYNTDIKGLTGQAEPIPMLISQQGTFPGTANSRSASTLAQWKLSVDYPGEILCVGPKYQYGYVPDRVHLDAASYVRLGEKYAQVLARTTILGLKWKPLQPRQMNISGTSITVDFDVPHPPLAWEESVPPPHQTTSTYWKNGRGFEVEDLTGPLTIVGVTIVENSVRIDLDKAPAEGVAVRYAMTQDVDGFTGGTLDARRGQLRDSDPFEGRSKDTILSSLTTGSALVTAAAGSTFAARAVGDIVTGGGLPEGTVVISKMSDTVLLLSQSFQGADGNVELSFRHDHRNYAVQFQMIE